MAEPRSPLPSKVERAAAAVAIAACVFYGLVAFWEIAGPLPGGHFSGMASFAIAGENMIHWRVFAVVPDYGPGVATPAQYYCHHPYGVYALGSIAYAFFGHHWFTTRLPAVLCSCLSAPLVYGFSRAAWGIVPAAIATLAFVFVPIDLALGNYVNLEVPVIFFGLLFSWGTIRFWQSWRTHYLLLGTIGALGACHCDWVGLVLVGVVGAFAFVRAYVLPRRWYGRLDERQHARWFAYTTAAAVGTLVLYIALFAKADKISDLIGSYGMRSSGHEAPWSDIFTPRRKMWLSWMITPIGLGTIALAFPVSLGRLTKRAFEIIPIAWTLAATFQYVVFKQGADVHIFWPHYYGPCVGLGAGVLSATLFGVLRRLTARVPPARQLAFSRGSLALVGILFLVPIALLARMALPQLYQARITSGRFDDGGRHIETDADTAAFAAWAANGLAPKAPIRYASPFPFGYNAQYGAHRAGLMGNTDPSPSGPGEEDRVVMLDTRLTAPSDLKALARKFSPVAVGPFWRIDRASKGPGIKALRYVEREPNLLERYFVVGSDLVREIGSEEDPWATWEWRTHLGIDAPSPSPAPGTFDELRIAHNVAVAHGDAAQAAALRARVASAMKNRRNDDFMDDVHLLGADVVSGAATVVTLLWETGPAFKPFSTEFVVRCSVTKAPPLWTSATDYFEKEMAPPAAIKPETWKPGYLYVQRFVALHRIGTEECAGLFTTPEMRPAAGGDRISLFTLK